MVVAGKFIAEVGVVEVVEKLSAEVVAGGVVVVADVEKVDVGTDAEAGALKNIGADVEAGTLKGVAAVVGVGVLKIDGAGTEGRAGALAGAAAICACAGGS